MAKKPSKSSSKESRASRFIGSDDDIVVRRAPKKQNPKRGR